MFFYFCFNSNGKITLNKLEHYLSIQIHILSTPVQDFAANDHHYSNTGNPFLHQQKRKRKTREKIMLLILVFFMFCLSSDIKGKIGDDNFKSSSVKKSDLFSVEVTRGLGCSVFASFSSMCSRTEQLYSLAYLVITHQFVRMGSLV